MSVRPTQEAIASLWLEYVDDESYTGRRVKEVLRRVRELEDALRALVEAEWMVTHDWGGDREAVIAKAEAALAVSPERTSGPEGDTT